MAYMAIQTKFLAPTDYRGDRIKATGMDTFNTDERKRTVTVPYDYGATMEQMHRKAAELLLPQIVSEPERICSRVPMRQLLGAPFPVRSRSGVAVIRRPCGAFVP